MTGLMEAIVSRFEVQDHFSDIEAGEVYILVDSKVEVTEAALSASCAEYAYTLRGMKVVDDDWKKLKARIVG